MILDVHLPPVAYRRLVGVRPTLADLCELSPSLGRGLRQLLEWEGAGDQDVEYIFCRNFVVEYEDPSNGGVGGGMRSVELMPGRALSHFPSTFSALNVSPVVLTAATTILNLYDISL